MTDTEEQIQEAQKNTKQDKYLLDISYSNYRIPKTKRKTSKKPEERTPYL